jgi:hypothetical protein
VGTAAREAKADVIPRVDCTNAAADATVTLGANTPSVSAVSSGAYWSSGCPRFVTDISVPTNTSSGYANLDQFQVYGRANSGQPALPQGWTMPLSQAACEDYVESVAVYKRVTLGGDFVFLGGGLRHGVWVTLFGFLGACHVVNDAAFVDVPLSSAPWVHTTYRVVVGARIGGYSWLQVRAGATYSPTPA